MDQINARVQVLTEAGGFLAQLGGLGVGYANFVRPKDVAVDEEGFVYVTDAAFGNVQIFDADLQLLTFVGSGGEGPGQFQIASGVAVRGDRFAIVDQLGRRVQVFRYLVPKTAPSPGRTTTAAVPAKPPHPLAPLPRLLAPLPHPLAPLPHPLAPLPHPLAPRPHPLAPLPHPLAPLAAPAAAAAAPTPARPRAHSRTCRPPLPPHSSSARAPC